MENDDNVMEFFTTALRNSVKVTRLHLKSQIINRNVILLTQFSQVY